MRRVDKLMVESYGITMMQMMENAGGSLARLARQRFLKGRGSDQQVVVLAGRGGNGGGGLVCARRLHVWGVNVRVITTHPWQDYRGVPRHQLTTLERMQGPVVFSPGSHIERSPDLLIDAIIGYGLSGSPHGQAAEMIRWANAQESPILSLDAPSGLDTTSGVAYSPTIQATATMTLALPKEGFRAPGAAAYVGELYLADISVPPDLYAQLGISVPSIFSQKDIFRVA